MTCQPSLTFPWGKRVWTRAKIQARRFPSRGPGGLGSGVLAPGPCSRSNLQSSALNGTSADKLKIRVCDSFWLVLCHSDGGPACDGALCMSAGPGQSERDLNISRKDIAEGKSSASPSTKAEPPRCMRSFSRQRYAGTCSPCLPGSSRPSSNSSTATCPETLNG